MSQFLSNLLSASVLAFLSSIPWSLLFCFVAPKVTLFPNSEFIPLPSSSKIDDFLCSDDLTKAESLNLMRLYFLFQSLSERMDARPYSDVVQNNVLSWSILSLFSVLFPLSRCLSFTGFFSVVILVLSVIIFYFLIFLEVKFWRKCYTFEPHDETTYHNHARALQEADSIKFPSYPVTFSEFYSYWSAQYSAYSMLESVRSKSLYYLRIAKTYGSILIASLFLIFVLLNIHIPDKSGYDSGYDYGYSEGYDIGYDSGFVDAIDELSENETSYEPDLTREGLPNPNTVVYVTVTGNKYHLDGCTYLGDSQIETTLSKARAEGYSPCSVCNPPS